jgi:hypothetical protein
VLTATFVAILWTTLETRRLVDGQERAAELARHPWLEATNLRPKDIAPRSGDAPFGGYHIWLPITNVGHTPAIDLEIDWTLLIEDPEIDEPARTQDQRVGQTLVPRDVLHQEIGRAVLNGPHTTILADVTIRYRTIDGGRGHLDVAFRFTAETGWRNLPTRYRTQLSDGTALPR